MENQKNWGDVDDEEYLPPTQTIGPDKDNIKTVISYEYDSKRRKVKLTRKYKVKSKEIRVLKKTVARNSWKNNKYGDAKGEGVGPNKANTTTSGDSIPIESVGEEKSEEIEMKFPEEGGGLYKAQAPSGLRSGLRRVEISTDENSNSYKYNPSLNRATAGTEDGIEKSTTLRITNLTAETTEADVRGLCSQYGRLSRVFLAWDRDAQRSKGFAYVSFYSRRDAEAALDKLDRAGYNHVILHVEWAKPNKREDGGKQGISNKHMSGYGGALPQGLTKTRTS